MADDDPLSPTAAHHLPQTDDDLELFRGSLMCPDACRAAGITREPCWLLLSAGVVVRSHACSVDGQRFLRFHEALLRFPILGRQPARCRRAWDRLLDHLRALGVDPVAGEAGDSSAQDDS